MNQFYYELNGQQIGPVTVDDLKPLQINGETLIWHTGVSGWTKAKEISELADYLNKLPPPLPTREPIEIVATNTITETVKSRRKFIPNLLVLLFLILSALAITYYLTEDYKKKDFQILLKTADGVFNGKNEICDYQKSAVKGDLTKSTEKDFGKRDNEGNSVYEYYKCEWGGWSVYSLEKLNFGYDLVNYVSTDMAFKVPESNYHQLKYNFDGYATPGYYTPTNRGSVQNAYDEAMERISVEKANKSYLAGSYKKIKTFYTLFSDLHYIRNVNRTRSTSASASVWGNEKSWKSYGEMAVYNNKWIVWYEYSGKHYEIVLDKDKYYKKLLLNIGIGLGIVILIYLHLKYNLIQRTYKNLLSRESK